MDIEILEEYEDLIMPVQSDTEKGGGDDKNRHGGMSVPRDDLSESSESVDMDIFDESSDEETNAATERVVENVMQKRHQGPDGLESEDSLEQLVRELAHDRENEPSTTTLTSCLKKHSSCDKSNNSTPQKHVAFAPLPSTKSPQVDSVTTQSASAAKPNAAALRKSTIIKPEKIQFQDPDFDPLRLDQRDDLNVLSDISDDSFVSVTDMDDTQNAPSELSSSYGSVNSTTKSSTVSSSFISTDAFPEKPQVISNAILVTADAALKDTLKSISPLIETKRIASSVPINSTTASNEEPNSKTEQLNSKTKNTAVQQSKTKADSSNNTQEQVKVPNENKESFEKSKIQSKTDTEASKSKVFDNVGVTKVPNIESSSSLSKTKQDEKQNAAAKDSKKEKGTNEEKMLETNKKNDINDENSKKSKDLKTTTTQIEKTKKPTTNTTNKSVNELETATETATTSTEKTTKDSKNQTPSADNKIPTNSKPKDERKSTAVKNTKSITSKGQTVDQNEFVRKPEKHELAAKSTSLNSSSKAAGTSKAEVSSSTTKTEKQQSACKNLEKSPLSISLKSETATGKDAGNVSLSKKAHSSSSNESRKNDATKSEGSFKKLERAISSGSLMKSETEKGTPKRKEANDTEYRKNLESTPSSASIKERKEGTKDASKNDKESSEKSLSTTSSKTEVHKSVNAKEQIKGKSGQEISSSKDSDNASGDSAKKLEKISSSGSLKNETAKDEAKVNQLDKAAHAQKKNEKPYSSVDEKSEVDQSLENSKRLQLTAASSSLKNETAKVKLHEDAALVKKPEKTRSSVSGKVEGIEASKKIQRSSSSSSLKSEKSEVGSRGTPSKKDTGDVKKLEKSSSGGNLKSEHKKDASGAKIGSQSEPNKETPNKEITASDAKKLEKSNSSSDIKNLNKKEATNKKEPNELKKTERSSTVNSLKSEGNNETTLKKDASDAKKLEKSSSVSGQKNETNKETPAKKDGSDKEEIANSSSRLKSETIKSTPGKNDESEAKKLIKKSSSVSSLKSEGSNETPNKPNASDAKKLEKASSSSSLKSDSSKKETGGDRQKIERYSSSSNLKSDESKHDKSKELAQKNLESTMLVAGSLQRRDKEKSTPKPPEEQQQKTPSIAKEASKNVKATTNEKKVEIINKAIEAVVKASSGTDPQQKGQQQAASKSEDKTIKQIVVEKATTQTLDSTKVLATTAKDSLMVKTSENPSKKLADEKKSKLAAAADVGKPKEKETPPPPSTKNKSSHQEAQRIKVKGTQFEKSGEAETSNPKSSVKAENKTSTTTTVAVTSNQTSTVNVTEAKMTTPKQQKNPDTATPKNTAEQEPKSFKTKAARKQIDSSTPTGAALLKNINEKLANEKPQPANANTNDERRHLRKRGAEESPESTNKMPTRFADPKNVSTPTIAAHKRSGFSPAGEGNNLTKKPKIEANRKSRRLCEEPSNEEQVVSSTSSQDASSKQTKAKPSNEANNETAKTTTPKAVKETKITKSLPADSTQNDEKITATSSNANLAGNETKSTPTSKRAANVEKEENKQDSVVAALSVKLAEKEREVKTQTAELEIEKKSETSSTPATPAKAVGTVKKVTSEPKAEISNALTATTADKTPKSDYSKRFKSSSTPALAEPTVMTFTEWLKRKNTYTETNPRAEGEQQQEAADVSRKTTKSYNKKSEIDILKESLGKEISDALSSSTASEDETIDAQIRLRSSPRKYESHAQQKPASKVVAMQITTRRSEIEILKELSQQNAAKKPTTSTTNPASKTKPEAKAKEGQKPADSAGKEKLPLAPVENQKTATEIEKPTIDVVEQPSTNTTAAVANTPASTAPTADIVKRKKKRPIKEIDLLRESMPKDMRESGIEELMRVHADSPRCLTKRSIATALAAAPAGTRSSRSRKSLPSAPTSWTAKPAMRRTMGPRVSTGNMNIVNVFSAPSVVASVSGAAAIATTTTTAPTAKVNNKNLATTELLPPPTNIVTVPKKFCQLRVRLNRSTVRRYFESIIGQGVVNAVELQKTASRKRKATQPLTSDAKRFAATSAEPPPPMTASNQAITKTRVSKQHFVRNRKGKFVSQKNRRRKGAQKKVPAATTTTTELQVPASISPEPMQCSEDLLLTPISVAPVLPAPPTISTESTRRSRGRKKGNNTSVTSTLAANISSTSVVRPIALTAAIPPMLPSTITNRANSQLQAATSAATASSPSLVNTSIAPKRELDEDDFASRSTTTAASSAAENFTLPPSSIPLVISGATSHSLPPVFIDNAGTRLYSYLHPTRYNSNHGNVMLDYCCPNLDGPMTAIDPTRRHDKIEAVVRELPAFISMETRLVTRAELEANSNSIPAAIRNKVQRMESSKSAVAGTSGARTNLANSNAPTVTPINLSALQKQLPSTTILTARNGPTQRTNTKTTAGVTGVSSTASTMSTTPTAIIKPTTLEEMRAKNIVSLKNFDIILKKHYYRISMLTYQERQRLQESMVNTTQLMSRDIDMATRVFQEYVTHMALITARPASPAQPPLAPTPIPKPAIVATTSAAPPTMSIPPTIQASPLTTSPTTRAQAKKVVKTIKAPPPKMIRKTMPIYNADRNIIGYQVQMVPQTTNESGAAVSGLGAKTTSLPTLAATSINSSSSFSNSPITSTSTMNATGRRSGVFVIDQVANKASSSPVTTQSNTMLANLLNTPTSLAPYSPSLPPTTSLRHAVMHSSTPNSTTTTAGGSVVTRSGRGVNMRQQIPRNTRIQAAQHPLNTSLPLTATTSTLSTSMPCLPTLTRNPHLPPLGELANKTTVASRAAGLNSSLQGTSANTSKQKKTQQHSLQQTKHFTRTTQNVTNANSNKISAGPSAQLMVVNHDQSGNPMPDADESILPDECGNTTDTSGIIKSEAIDY